MKLNARQQAFVEHYILDKNITRAAKAAGYSDKTSYSIGSRLLKNVEVKKEIDARMSKISVCLDKTVEEIAERFVEIGFGNSKLFHARDQLKALELLGRYKKMFTDKVEHSGPDGAPQQIVILPAQDGSTED